MMTIDKFELLATTSIACLECKEINTGSFVRPNFATLERRTLFSFVFASEQQKDKFELKFRLFYRPIKRWNAKKVDIKILK